MLHRRAIVALALLALASTGCAGVEGEDPPETPGNEAPQLLFPLTLTDDENVEVTLEAEPERIVTFAPSNTEILFELGVGDRLVGVSGDFDDYPPESLSIEHVGGAGEFGADPNVEKVVSLEPDLVLTIGGGQEWKERLRELDIPVFTVNATDFDDLLDDIGTIGHLTGAEEEAAAVVAEMQAAVEDAVAGSTETVTCFFEAYHPPLTSVGPKTFIFDLLERAGCDPVTADAASDYPEWSLEKLVDQSPEVYIVTQESATAEDVAGRPGFDAIGAVAKGRVFEVNSDLVTRPGPRVVEGLAQIAEALSSEP